MKQSLPALKLFLLLGLLAGLGCGRDSTLYPIRGTVTVDGKPAAKLLVLFYVVDDPAPYPSPATALTDDNGSFTLTTAKEADGAVAGEYAVAFQWYNVHLRSDGEPVHSGPDKLGGRYADRKTTPVRAGVNEPLVFNLTSR